MTDSKLTWLQQIDGTFIYYSRAVEPTMHGKKYLPSRPINGTITVYNLSFPMQDYFEKILDAIPCVKSFTLFITTINLELKIKNQHCKKNRQEDNLITFILTWNINTYLSYYTTRLTLPACTFSCISYWTKDAMRKCFTRRKCN